MDLELVLNEATFQYYSMSEEVFGEVYLRHGSKTFPSETWTDFVVSLIVGWYDKIESRTTAANKELILYFVDGPYHLKLNPNHNEMWHFSLEERTPTDPVCQYEGDCSISKFKQSIRNAAVRTVRQCERMKVTPVHYDLLKSIAE